MKLPALLLFFVAFIAFAQPSPESTKPVEKSAPKEEKSGACNSNADKIATAIGVVNSPIQNTEPKGDQPDHNQSILGIILNLLKVSVTTIDGWTFWVLIVQSGFLWWTITTMRKSDEQQLRPYVSFNFPKAPWPTDAGVISFEFVCINHGESPAKDLKFRADAWCLDSQPTDGRILPRIGDFWNEERMNLFPNDEERQKTWFTPCTLGTIFTQEEVRKVISNNGFLVLGMEVGYTDIFNKKHTTGAYYVIKGSGHVSLIPRSSTLT